MILLRVQALNCGDENDGDGDNNNDDGGKRNDAWGETRASIK